MKKLYISSPSLYHDNFLFYSDGPAIYLDDELYSGHTHRCETYGNMMFNKSEDKMDTSFKCLALEVFLLD